MTMLHKPKRPPFELTGMGLRYRIWTLAVDETVIVPNTKANKGQLTSMQVAFLPKRFETRKTNEGLRVWRVE
jgi:hypothetical protein